MSRSARLLHVGADEVTTVWAVASQMKAVAIISAALSLTIAAVESLAMAGLVTLLTAKSSSTGIGLTSASVEAVASPPAVIGLAVLSLLLNLTQTWVRERVTGDWELTQRRALIDAFGAADYPAQINYSSGRLTSAGEFIAAGGNTIGGIIGLIGFGARALVYGAVSVIASWQVAAIAVVCGSVLVLLLRMVSRRTRTMNTAIARSQQDVTEDIADLSPSARELHALNRWPVTTERLTTQLTEIRNTRLIARLLAGMVGPVYAMGTLMVGVGVAVWATHQGASTTRLAISGLLLVRALGSAQSTQVGFQAVNDAIPFMERGLQAINELRAAARRTGGLVDRSDDGGAVMLQVRNACVSYGNDTVVKDLHLDLPDRGGLALIGPSGAGKSTTLLALSGLLRPETGVVTFGGADLSKLDLAEVTNDIGYLPQDPRLIRATLRENLLRWPTQIDDSRLELLLDRAGLMDTVQGFAGGLDSTMGRAAEGLSGGELQRLGLVRLLLASPPVMLLDEPTSALDRHNADRVSALIEEAMVDHLVVLVTHRPDLLLHCSEMVYMEGGRAVDHGTLAELRVRHRFVDAMARGLGTEATDASQGR